MNNLLDYADVFQSIQPWSGRVPAGFTVDFFGNLTAKEFLEMWGYHPAFIDGAELQMELPTLGGGSNGEFWFEAADWVLAAREARDRFVMVTLGALYGYQAIGSHRALQLLNPMPYKLVAIEPIPENVEWVKRHMRDNGIDPEQQWIMQAIVSDTNEPAFFPVGSPGAGAQNCISTNEPRAREDYVRELVADGRTEHALSNLLLRNTTGLTKDVVPGKNFMTEIKLVSSITLHDVLGPFDVVDFLESDIQQSEIVVFPPHMDVLKRKVRRIHMGTHGADVHQTLHDMFAEHGWDIVFSFLPDREHDTPLGRFATNDGILTVRNPDF